jgi:hypothetical protein
MPLPDAAYHRMQRRQVLDRLARRAGLGDEYRDGRSRMSVNIDRLRAIHPKASEDALSRSVSAAEWLDKVWSHWPHGDPKGRDFITYVREEAPGFTEQTYRDAYHDMRVAYR